MKEQVLRSILGHMGGFTDEQISPGSAPRGGVNITVAHITRGPAPSMLHFCRFDLFLSFKMFFYHHIHHCLCPKTRRTLFLLKLGSFQFAILKIAFTILSIVLYTNDLFDLSDVSPVTLSLILTFHFFCLFDLFNILLQHQ